VYHGRQSGELMSDWRREASNRRLDQARTEQTITYADADTGLLVRYESLRDEKERSQAWTEKQLTRMKRGMAQMVTNLAERPWCQGERYSLADIAVGCCLGWLNFRKPGDVDWLREYPALAKHYDKLMARPAFADTAPQLPK
jgi:glutathione S-transferase